MQTPKKYKNPAQAKAKQINFQLQISRSCFPAGKMDPDGKETGQWTNEKHLHFISSMEAAFVRTMLQDNGGPLRLDRYLPDSSESTLDLKSHRSKRQSASGSSNGGRRNRVDRRTKRSPSSDHQSQISGDTQDQVVPQLEFRFGDKNDRDNPNGEEVAPS